MTQAAVLEDQLERLLEAEAAIDVRLRCAEEAAERRVAEARRLAAERVEQNKREIEAALRRLEADLKAEAEVYLDGVRSDLNSRLQPLNNVSNEALDDWASEVVRRVLGEPR